MQVVIEGNFPGRSQLRQFNADIYASDLKLLQVEILAESPHAAFEKVMLIVSESSTSPVRCLLIYEGVLSGRSEVQAPVLLHQVASAPLSTSG